MSYIIIISVALICMSNISMHAHHIKFFIYSGYVYAVLLLFYVNYRNECKQLLGHINLIQNIICIKFSEK